MAQNRGKVLVIDDDKTTCGFVEKMLLPRGVAVACHADPFDGIERAREMQPDLIFINLLMGESNGLKVSKAIRSIDMLSAVPVVIFVSYEGELDPKYISTLGIVDVMVKPLREKEFLAKTAAILQRRAGVSASAAGRTEAAVARQEAPSRIPEIEAVETEEADLLSGGSGEDAFAAFLAEEKDAGPAPARASSAAVRHDFELPEEKEPPSGPNAPEAVPARDQEPEYVPDESEDEFGEEPLPQPRSRGRKIMLAAVGVVGVIGVVIGAWFAKRIFVDGQEMVLEKGMTSPDQKVITDNRPSGVPALPKPGETPVVAVPVPETLQQAGPAKQETPQSASRNKPADTVQDAALQNRPAEVAPAAKAQPAKQKETPPAAEPAKTAKQKKQAAKTAAVKKSGRQWVVQVGLFSSEQNANAIVEKLKQKGYSPASKQEKLADGQIRFRVTAGSYDSKQKAVEAAQTLLKKEGVTSVVHAF